MVKIALLSDTHGYLDERFIKHFLACDEIWHAGDIGTTSLADQLAMMKPLRAVHGNIDGQPLRLQFPADQRFNLEDVSVWIRHIGGYPGHYEKEIRDILRINPPRLLITGHSHILKIQYDKHYELLYINPGAAGRYGFHTLQTLVKFKLHTGNITDMEVVELNRS
jgi:putative phosphoesterase